MAKKTYVEPTPTQIPAMVPVTSGLLEAVGHDGKGCLFLQFKHGSRIWRYRGVDVTEFEALKGAPSVGKAAQRFIKSRDSYPADAVVQEVAAMADGDQDWDRACEICKAVPTMHPTGLCGPCCTGEAATAGGEW